MNTLINTGGPAFPCGRDVTLDQWEPETGMTLRDYFAAHAPFTAADAEKGIRGVSAEPPTGSQLVEMLAGMRYAYADAMIQASSV